jgi:SAM-dependent methyltransferase
MTADAAARADGPLVSIVVTTYNHARFLAESLESALAQTERSTEVIVVDDGSQDDPAAVVATFPEVRLIRQPNRGLAAARNTGWRAARGRYVVFLDADDRLLSHALAVNLRRFARRRECAFVYGGYEFIDADGRPLATPEPVDVGDDPYAAFLEGNRVGMHATVMYRRECLAAAGGFDPALPACEDYDLYLRLARDHPVASGPECLAQYRWHGENMSANLPMMLSAALAVLGRHEARAAANPRWRAAHANGVRAWKEFYSRRQLAHACEAVERAGPGATPVGDIARMLRLAPVGLVTVAAREIASGLRGRVRRWRRARRRRAARGTLDLGDLRRTTPVSRVFGFDRGTPVDRRYIEEFLARHADDVRGRVLEVGDDTYTVRFGGGRVTRSDVLHVTAGNERATLVGDLAAGDHLPSEAFDCIVLTQTLHLVFDVARAGATLHRLLAPGGVLLVTVPGVSSVDRGEWGASWYWSFTPASLHRVLAACWGDENVSVTTYGNVLAAVGFLHGLAEDELADGELAPVDPQYPVIVAARAVKEHARAARDR